MSNQDAFKIDSLTILHTLLTECFINTWSNLVFLICCCPRNAFPGWSILCRLLVLFTMPHSISCSHFREVPWDISFSGSGFLATYQLGVVLCLLKYAPWILKTAPHILGASAGSVVAAAVVCKINPSKWTYCLF